ncbi:glycoside hydrolase superfamily [Ilyonectria robusta]|uniref:glycoside hydrolase superfamily n=1 Tax=Ilyonectria robusta TaxID=1079257 RepID=UPI001E8DA6D5|nr:glycoside hydrolase superfamily [Ilyonectria robusta]KAH8648837.1 glycoside hydrolase superfamily [Ilyonectria robusta]
MLDSQSDIAYTAQATGRHPAKSQDTPFLFTHAVQAIKNGDPIEDVVQRLLSELTKTERLHLLDGDDEFWVGLRKIMCDRYNKVPFVHGEVSRLGIPGVRFSDGPRGVVMGSSTAFPVSIARGATWDVALERRIGNAIGLEAKAQGANFFAGVCVNLPRHPAWGRIQETYGEDPLILGHFGLALTEGVQNHIMACVKHLALNSMENARFRVDVKVSDDVLHEVYLPHFRRIIEGGAASVMSAYNSVNGEWAGQNKRLLTDILRGQWGFDGFTISDFIFGLRDAALSVKNGLDIEAPFKQQRGLHLSSALESGELQWRDINQACSRILKKELEFEIKTEGSNPDSSVVFCEEHRTLAREAASRAVVVLKNDVVDKFPLLPLDTQKLSKIAVLGRLANVGNTGDRGSSQVFPPHIVTAYEGLKTAFTDTEVLLEDSDSVEKAREVASQVDVAICIVGYDAADEGEYVVPSLQNDPLLGDLLPPVKAEEEQNTLNIMYGGSSNGLSSSALEVGSGGDRRSLRLRPRDIELITAVTAKNPRTIVTIVAAGAVILEDWKSKTPALLMSWYAGSEGGHALADVLLGRVDASGRLPFSIPQDESHLPYYNIEASEISYDRWFGQHLLDKLGVAASFPFGFGMSYSTFGISDLHIAMLGSGIASNNREYFLVHLKVANTGNRDGRYIAQVYGKPNQPDFPSRVLLGFSPVDLAVGESKSVLIDASLRPLQRWVEGKFTLPSGPVVVEVASFASDPGALRSTIDL